MEKISIGLRSNVLMQLKEIAFKEVVKNPKVSIIVPTYNNEIYLAKCLLSLAEQTLKEIEIIVVNDGSTDNTSSILRTFAHYDTRFKIINQNIEIFFVIVVCIDTFCTF